MGRGASGLVYIAYDLQDGRKPVAVKQISTEKMNKKQLADLMVSISFDKLIIFLIINSQQVL
jgi:serine/threonine protein kinase